MNRVVPRNTSMADKRRNPEIGRYEPKWKVVRRRTPEPFIADRSLLNKPPAMWALIYTCSYSLMCNNWIRNLLCKWYACVFWYMLGHCYMLLLNIKMTYQPSNPICMHTYICMNTGTSGDSSALTESKGMYRPQNLTVTPQEKAP